MAARRCDLACAPWPAKPPYKVCPECQEPTKVVSNDTPLSDDEAQSRARHAEFERFYEEWDASHDPERLVPGEDDLAYGFDADPDSFVSVATSTDS
jgi:hypothetical protein